ncbi:uncharacterized protein LOC144349558 [Saccoglossus kowalevskii]
METESHLKGMCLFLAVTWAFSTNQSHAESNIRQCTWTDLERCNTISAGVLLNPMNWDLPDTMLWCQYVQKRRDCFFALNCDKSSVNETPFNFTTILKNQVRTHLIYIDHGFCDLYTSQHYDNMPDCHSVSIKRNCLHQAALYVKSPAAQACTAVLKILFCINRKQIECGELYPSQPTETNIYRMYDTGHCQYIPFNEYRQSAEIWRSTHPNGFCSNCM